MTLALLIIAGVVVYSAVAGVLYYYNPMDCRDDDARFEWALAWLFWFPFIGPVVALTAAMFETGAFVHRLLTRRAERKRLPQAKVVSK